MLSWTCVCFGFGNICFGAESFFACGLATLSLALVCFLGFWAVGFHLCRLYFWAGFGNDGLCFSLHLTLVLPMIIVQIILTTVHNFTVQLDNTWRQSGLSSVNKTSPTFSGPLPLMMTNCGTLTTSPCFARDLWEKLNWRQWSYLPKRQNRALF